MRLLVAAAVLAAAVWGSPSGLPSPATLAAQPRADNRPALSGYVLTPEWLPVAGGSVSARSLGSERAASIGSDGRFRIESLATGMYDVSVSAPPLMTRTWRVAMPASGNLTLPPLGLAAGSYLRYKFVARGGAPVESPRIMRASFRPTGERVHENPGDIGRTDADPHGATLIGPVPPGMTVLAVDTPPYARMRLRDLRVTGESPLFEAGTVILQSGAVLNVSIVDARRAPVSNHAVILDEGLALSPLWWPPMRTDSTGRAMFDRLAPRRYYVRTSALERCGGFYPPGIRRSINVPLGGTAAITVVIDGTAKLRLMMDGAPLRAKPISLTPEAPPTPMPSWLRADAGFAPRLRSFDRFREDACLGATDADGRVGFPHVPPGAARLAVRVGDSTWVRHLELAGNDREVVLEIPSGVLPVRVVDHRSGAPVSAALITWSSGGAQVEASSSATGEALLQGVAVRQGVLTIEAPGYQRRELKLAEPPDVLHEVALERTENLEVRCRVVTDGGRPVAGAVVELAPHDRVEVPQVATTDRDGRVRFTTLSPGPARLMVWAERHPPAVIESAIPVDSDGSGDVMTITLARGYRIDVAAESSLPEGVHAVRVSNQAGESVDALLDTGSERVIQRGGRVSLGPLPRGSYTVELRSASGARKERVDINDRDPHVTFR